MIDIALLLEVCSKLQLQRALAAAAPNTKHEITWSAPRWGAARWARALMPSWALWPRKADIEAIVSGLRANGRAKGAGV